MKRIFQSICKTILAGFVSLVILSVIVLCFFYSGIHVANETGATDYKWNGKQLKTTTTEGFSWIRMDEDGFNNPKLLDNDSKIDILLMGSSHFEAVNVTQTENSSSILASLLPDHKVYNIGISGHDIYRCAKNLKCAVDYYAPTRYVVIETDQLLIDESKMEMVLRGELQTIQSYDSGYLYYLQLYCPALKNIYKNVEDWKSVDSRNEAICTFSNEPSDDLLYLFLSKMKEDCGNRELIIVYHPSFTIDENGSLIISDADSERYSEICDDVGITFVDMTQSFISLYTDRHILTHGFINTAVGSGHLNKYGHQAIAERLSEVIIEGESR